MMGRMDPRELEVRVAIGDLVSRYPWAADRLRVDDLAELFAQDAVLDNGPGREVHTRAGIHAYFSTPGMGSAYGAGHAVTHVRHHVSNHVVDGIDLDAGTADGRCYFAVYTDRGLEQWGRYFDTYVLEDGAWRFASRKVRVDGWAAP
jgi:hypothetical protein